MTTEEETTTKKQKQEKQTQPTPIVSPFEGNQRVSFPSSAMSFLSSEFRDNDNDNDNDNGGTTSTGSTIGTNGGSSHGDFMSMTHSQMSQPFLFAPDLTEQMKIPITQDDADVVDNALADEMLKLNMTDYDKINFEIYGINEDIDEETPQFLENKYLELEYEIDKQLRRKKSMLGFKKSSTKTMEYVLNKHPDFVNDKKFRLAFLRSERFDAKLAAEKMIRHFSQKMDLFGNGEVMGRDVKLSDLSSADITVLESGMLQVLPIRDTGGRFIYVVRPEIRCQLVKDGKVTAINIVRAWFYIIWCVCSKSEECQKKGMVIILYIVGMSEGLFPIAKELGSRRDCLPNKVVSLHLCYDKQTLRPWMAAHKLYSMSKRNRARLRKHYGDHGEAIFKLQTYGIPVNDKDHFPKDGSVPLTLHQEWLMIQRYQEEQGQIQGQSLNLLDLPAAAADTIVSNSNFIVDIVDDADLILLLGEEEEEEVNVNVNVNVHVNNNNTNIVVSNSSNIVEQIVEADDQHECEHEHTSDNGDDDDDEYEYVNIIPTKNDVLFGKGKNIKEHNGNKRCFNLVTKYQIEYEKAGKFAKTDISERIVSMIHDDYDGRFLKFNKLEDQWEEVERGTAREKISHYFRHIRKKQISSLTSSSSAASAAASASPVFASTSSSITSTSIKRDVPFPSLLSNNNNTTMIGGSGSEQHDHYEERFWKKSRA